MGDQYNRPRKNSVRQNRRKRFCRTFFVCVVRVRKGCLPEALFRRRNCQGRFEGLRRRTRYRSRRGRYDSESGLPAAPSGLGRIHGNESPRSGRRAGRWLPPPHPSPGYAHVASGSGWASGLLTRSASARAEASALKSEPKPALGRASASRSHRDRARPAKARSPYVPDWGRGSRR